MRHRPPHLRRPEPRRPRRPGEGRPHRRERHLQGPPAGLLRRLLHGGPGASRDQRAGELHLPGLHLADDAGPRHPGADLELARPRQGGRCAHHHQEGRLARALPRRRRGQHRGDRHQPPADPAPVVLRRRRLRRGVEAGDAGAAAAQRVPQRQPRPRHEEEVRAERARQARRAAHHGRLLQARGQGADRLRRLLQRAHRQPAHRQPRAEPGGDGAGQDPARGRRALHLHRRRLGLLARHQDDERHRSLRQPAARQPGEHADPRGHRLVLGRQRDELAERAGAVRRDPLPRGRRLRRALGGRLLAHLPQAAEERRLCREAARRRRRRGVHPLRRARPARRAHREDLLPAADRELHGLRQHQHVHQHGGGADPRRPAHGAERPEPAARASTGNTAPRSTTATSTAAASATPRGSARSSTSARRRWSGSAAPSPRSGSSTPTRT